MRFRFYYFIAFIFCTLSTSIKSQVIAGFTANRTSGCAPLSVNFTNTSTGATTYSWNLGNGNTSALLNAGATYNTPGVYSVILTASSGASSNTHTISISVYGNPTPDFTTSAMPSCVGQTVTFTDNSVSGTGSLASWDWDFGDGTSITSITNSVTHTYNAGGTFPVTMIVTNSDGCSRNVIHNVNILNAPQANFTGTPSTACVPPTPVNFTNTSTSAGAVTYLWNFGDGNTSTLENPTNLYNFSGSYPVTLEITQQGCKDTMTKPNFVTIEDIVPDFTANNTSVCAGQVIDFTDASTPLTSSRTWDFGDGSTSNLANPTHAYAAAGTYTVSMLNATANGCTNNVVKNNFITVFSSPIVSFAASQTNSCRAPFTTTFNDNSVNAVSWDWDFGDGNTSTLRNPTHTYTSTGSYNVSLTVTSANGCERTLVRNNYIFISAPVAEFTADTLEGCIPLPVAYTSTSSSANDPISNYIWDFGNGTATSVLPTVNRTYATVGEYTVRLIITTNLGCRDTITKVNYVQAGTPPTANFSVVTPSVCHGTEAEFTDLSVGADSAHWEFDVEQGVFDTPVGAVMPFNPVLHSLFDTGTFFVRQIAFSYGCPDTFQINSAIQILPPLPMLSYTLNCLTPNVVSFTDISVAADSIVWYFLDGSPDLSNVASVTHTYPNFGPQGVALTAFNFATGCSENITQVFTLADPLASFSVTPNIGCYPLPVTFANLSIDENTVTWNFGDGSPISTDTTSFVHTYTQPGNYPVTLTVTDVNGCVDSTNTSITVYGPQADFSAVTRRGCTPLDVNFNDNSVSDSTLVQWTWNFGDSTSVQTTASPNISHTYSVTGVYSVTMTVTDKNGCTHTRRRNNYIESTFPIPAIVADTFICKRVGVFLDASSTDVAEPSTFNWDFGDGSTGTGNGPVHFYSNDSLYNLTLTVTDKNGCAATLQHNIRVQTPEAAFTYSVISQACGTSNIQFTDMSTGLSINGWQWDFGDGASSLQQNPTHVYTRPGYFPVTLIINNVAGCLDTFLLDSLLVLGPTGTFSFTPNRGCIPLQVTFTAVSSNATNYNWDFGDGTVINTINPIITHTYTQADTATPFLLLGNILPDGSPCQFPAPTAGNVVATTAVTVNIDSVLNTPCNGDSLGSIFTSTTGGTMPYTYAWTTNPIQTLSTATNLAAGTYTITVTDSNFCATPAFATITEPDSIITIAGINDTVCPGQIATLTATASGGSGNYIFAWQPTGGINGGTMNIVATSDSVLTVTAFDQNNCAGTSVTTTAIVYSLPPDSIQVFSTSPICLGQSSDIFVQTTGPTGSLTYQWNPNIGNGSGVYQVTPLVPTSYFVTISNTCGASITESADVVFYAPPTMVISADTLIICAPDTINFTDNSVADNPADPVTIWNWNFGDGTPSSSEQNPTHVFTQAGLFSVNLTVTTADGCTNNNITTPIIVNSNPYPIANFSVNSHTLDLPYDATVIRNQTFGASTYAWDFGDGFTSTEFNPTHLYSAVGNYDIQLIATSANGCIDTTYLTISTRSDVVFPNVFTPNINFASGGTYNMNSFDNDVFFPYTSGVVEYLFQIYNRWGELIFESKDVKIGWDGYYKGKLCQQDVYIWKAYIKHNNGREFHKSGDVTLLR